MIHITEQQHEILKESIDNLDKLLQSAEVEELLECIDDLIVNNILGNNDEPDDTGVLLQRIYDQIYNQNYS